MIKKLTKQNGEPFKKPVRTPSNLRQRIGNIILDTTGKNTKNRADLIKTFAKVRDVSIRVIHRWIHAAWLVHYKQLPIKEKQRLIAEYVEQKGRGENSLVQASIYFRYAYNTIRGYIQRHNFRMTNL